MATRKTTPSAGQKESVSTTPEIVSTPSPSQGGDYSPFIWQTLSEIQRSLGALQSSVDELKLSTASNKSKVQELVDLRHKIFGGLIVVGVIISIASAIVAWTANKVWTTFAEVARPALTEAVRPAEVQKTPAPASTEPPPATQAPH